MLQGSVFIDNEQSPQRDTCVFKQDAITARNILAQISYERIVHSLDTTILAIDLCPRVMRELRVDRHTDYVSVSLLELLNAVGKSQNLGWTYEREVERIKEQHN